MQKKLTLSIDETVYDGLHRIVGRGKISQFIEDLVRPCLLDSALDAGYRAMAADKKREAEALEWSNALAGDSADEAR
ncbi:MAG: addiction module antitoxin [Candidatus Accumulibacter phosphatis]|jgi:hypothetical protein|uniref:Addiction module antitoxin n=2 Tax=Candidatus Accumulibacter TaxID=327159 RepID=A0A6A7RSN3_9PROT|nr:addiction module antitoxin [Candidatus Accumulibacter phosphatis]RDE52449.1 MAG: addiction module antitoxin [Candidatus Accumulibacter meliphilus]